MDSERYLTTEEVAAMLRTSPESVRWWRHCQKGPPNLKAGRRVLYPESRLVEWIDSRMGTPAGAA